MRILLPPSEAKRPGGRARPRPDEGPLAEHRAQALHALAALLEAGDGVAAAALLLPERVAAEAIAANRAVATAPRMPALRRYAGVVYDGLAYETLAPAAQRAAARSTLIFSGLWGVVRGDEPVPAYRVPAKAALPGVGVAATFWRPRLDAYLPDVLGRHLVVDLRSSDYAAMWRPRAELAERVVTVRVLSPLPRGGLGVVSYSSKHAKGRLAAELARRAADGIPCADTDDLVAAWAACGGRGAEVDGRRVDLVTGPAGT